MFLVVLQVNEKAKRAESGKLLAEKADVFAGRPGVHDIGSKAIGKESRPVADDLIEPLDAIILLTQAGAPASTFRDRNRGGMPGSRQLVGKIMDMDSAVRAEIMIKNEKDVTHSFEG